MIVQRDEVMADKGTMSCLWPKLNKQPCQQNQGKLIVVIRGSKDMQIYPFITFCHTFLKFEMKTVLMKMQVLMLKKILLTEQQQNMLRSFFVTTPTPQ